MRQGLHSAEEVVISGNSAGAKATYIHLDWWARQIHAVAPMAEVVGLPDDGMFLDFDRDYSVFSDERTTWEGNVRGRYTQQIQWVYHMMNVTASLDQSCLAHYAPQMVPWKCMFAQYVLPFVETPVFMLQTIYDSWQMEQILVHEGYEEPVREFAQLAFTATQSVNSYDWHGGWLTGCYKHCGLWSEIVIDGVNTPEAFRQFRAGTKRVWTQGMMDHPCETCCQSYVNPRSADFSLTSALSAIGSEQATSTPVVGFVKSDSNNALGIGLGVGGGALFLLLVAYIVFLHNKVERRKTAKDKFKDGIKRVMVRTHALAGCLTRWLAPSLTRWLTRSLAHSLAPSPSARSRRSARRTAAPRRSSRVVGRPRRRGPDEPSPTRSSEAGVHTLIRGIASQPPTRPGPDLYLVRAVPGDATRSRSSRARPVVVVSGPSAPSPSAQTPLDASVRERTRTRQRSLPSSLPPSLTPSLTHSLTHSRC